MRSVFGVAGSLAIGPNVFASGLGTVTYKKRISPGRSDKRNAIHLNDEVAYGKTTLPKGIRSRFLRNINGLRMHFLEAGFEIRGRPCVLLLHGFPELAYSWRDTMLPLAEAGYHVIVPDQRGYGRTSGWEDDYDADLSPYRFLNLVRDCLALVFALGYRKVESVIGHDFGSPVAAWCALTRPDVFSSVILMSAPFSGPPSFPFDVADKKPSSQSKEGKSIHEKLAELPEPRKRYFRYYTTRKANRDMLNCPQGVHDFLRAYFHMKSADWEQNDPFPLKARTAEEMAKLPPYYTMKLDKTMPETVAPHLPSEEEIAECEWLTEEEMRVYSQEFARTGFQGGLNWYRSAGYRPDLLLFSGRTIDVPSCFIAGSSDWGAYQSPGALEKMKNEATTHFRGIHFVDGAGHWVQQEQPEKTNQLIQEFLQAK
jgi:pimeloyl-ACP methyl ester carboxylesterase